MQQINQMKPILKSFVFFSEVDEGVYFNGGSEKSFIIQGKGLYPIVTKLIAAMDGKRSVESIKKMLPEQLQPLFARVLTQLHERSLLTDNRPTLELVPEALKLQYENVLSYISDIHDKPEQVFMNWHQMQVAVIGSGFSVKSLIKALARLGLGNLDGVIIDGVTRPEPEEIKELLLNIPKHTPHLKYQLLNGVTDCLHDLKKYDAIILASDDLTTLIKSTNIFSKCHELSTQVTLVGAWQGHGLLVNNPSLGADSKRLTALDRLQPNKDSVQTLTSYSVMGNLAAYELLKQVMGRTREVSGYTNNVSDWCLHISAGPEVTMRPLFEVPKIAMQDTPKTLISSVPEFSPEMKIENSVKLLKEELETLFDPYFGLLSNEPADNLSQLPLSQEAFEVYFPRPCERINETVGAWGFSPNEAYLKGLYLAVSTYANGIRNIAQDGSTGGYIAALEQGEWFEKAYLDATLHSPLMQQLTSIDLSVTDQNSGDINMLKSTISEMSNSVAEVTLMTIPNLPFYYCLTKVNSHTASGVSVEPTKAIVNSLASLCTALQLGKQNYSTKQPLVLATDQLPINMELTIGLDESLIDKLNAKGFVLIEDKFNQDPAVSNTSLLIGRLILMRER